MAKAIDPEIREGVEAAAESSGCSVIEAAFHGDRLQIVLDRPEGITVSDCETVSKKVSAFLDATDFGPDRYILEVSSPGLDRKLYGADDYVRFTGRRARLTWRDPERGKRTDRGRLSAVEPGTEAGHEEVVLTLDGGDDLRIPLTEVSEARLEIEI